MKKETNVITYGTFDLLHYGHINLLKRAKALGDNLFVGISNDAFNKTKQKNCHYEYAHRKYLIESIRYVDFTFEEQSWNQKIDDIKKYKIDIFTIGDDWKGQFDFLKEICEVKYLPRSPGISSSLIKDRLGNA